jgi:hypothetical protein
MKYEVVAGEFCVGGEQILGLFLHRSWMSQAPGLRRGLFLIQQGSAYLLTWILIEKLIINITGTGRSLPAKCFDKLSVWPT